MDVTIDYTKEFHEEYDKENQFGVVCFIYWNIFS